MWKWIARLLTNSHRTNEARVDAPAPHERAPVSRIAPPPPVASALRVDWQSWLAAGMRSTIDAPVNDVAAILDALPAARLIAVDATLRYGSWREYWHHGVANGGPLPVPDGTPREVAAFLFAHACAANGYPRQRALKALPAHPGRLALAAALIRTDDWVAEVRDSAGHALRALLPACGDDLFALLPLVDALRQRERFAAGAWPALVEPVLLDPRHASSRSQATQSANRGTRAIGYALVERADPERRLQACRQAIADADPGIARWALGVAANGEAGVELLRHGLHHPFGGVRAESLRRLVAAGVADLRALLERALFDETASVRDVAAYWLRERFGVDARAAWRQALDAGTDPAAGLALLALCERAEAIDVERIRPFLRAPAARARIAALKAIAAAQPDDVDDVLGQGLCDPSGRVVIIALRLLRRRPGALSADALRTAFAANAGARPLLLAAVPRIDQWQGLRLLLDWLAGATDDREAIALRLRHWLDATNHRFAHLSTAMRDDLRLALARARTDAVDVDWSRLEALLA
jgi:hypothetical protein